MRDPLSRKLFTTRDAREHLRGMGGIMASSPRLAETVAKFNLGGDVIAPVVGASQEPALVVYSGNNFAVFPDGRVVNTDSGVEVDDAQDPDGFLRRAVQALVSGPQPVTSVPGFGMDAFTAPIDLGGSDVFPQPTTREELLERGIVQRSFSDRLGDILDPVFSPMPDVDSEEFRALQAADPDLGAEILRRAQEAQKRRADDPAAAAADAAARTEAEAEAGDAETRAVDQTAAEQEATEQAAAAEQERQEAARRAQEELERNRGTGDTGGDLDTTFDQMLARLERVMGTKDEDSRQKAMANLAMIGLAIAAGQSPDALTNIAQGALTGMQAIRREQASEEATQREMRLTALQMASAEVENRRKLQNALTVAGLRGADGSESTRQEYLYNDVFRKAYEAALLEGGDVVTATEIARDAARQAAPNAPSAQQDAAGAGGGPGVVVTETERHLLGRGS
jgi:hypothetical protein